MFDWDGEFEEAWRAFRRRLADAVAALGDGERIYLAAPQYDLGVLRLGDELVLERCGAEVPGGIAVSETVASRECDHVAVRAVIQLQGSGALHPALVDGEEWQTVPAVSLPRVPEPELVRPESCEQLREAVDRALAHMLGGTVGHDADGHIQIVVGQSAVFVEVNDACPRVDLFCELVWDIRRADCIPGLLEELADSYIYQFSTDQERIVLRYSLPAWPFVPEQLRDFLTGLLDRLDEIADAAALRLDALRFRDEPRAGGVVRKSVS